MVIYVARYNKLNIQHWTFEFEYQQLNIKSRLWRELFRALRPLEVCNFQDDVCFNRHNNILKDWFWKNSSTVSFHIILILLRKFYITFIISHIKIATYEVATCKRNYIVVCTNFCGSTNRWRQWKVRSLLIWHIRHFIGLTLNCKHTHTVWVCQKLEFLSLFREYVQFRAWKKHLWHALRFSLITRKSMLQFIVCW